MADQQHSVPENLPVFGILSPISSNFLPTPNRDIKSGKHKKCGQIFKSIYLHFRSRINEINFLVPIV